jgi:putative transposase
VDENAIFQAIDTMRRIAEEALHTTKAVRRQQERRMRLIQGGRSQDSDETAAAEPSVPETKSGVERYPWENMLPVEEWE